MDNMTSGPVDLAHFTSGLLLPMPARRHAGMISTEERFALFGLTTNHFTGEGKIVDGGCFLGASTVCFGAALRRRGFEPRKYVNSYDRGLIASMNMARLANSASGREDFKVKDDFGDLIGSLIAPFADYVDLRLGDIREVMDEPDPIEILFLDVCKMADINAIVTRKTFPRLIPGRSILIHQDYFHDWLPWLHVTMGHFASHFSYIGAAGGSAFFLCEKAISEADVATDPWSLLPAQAAMAAFDRGLPERMELDQKYLIDIARTVLIRRHFGEHAAVEAMAKIVKPGLDDVTSNWTMPEKDGVMGWITSKNFN